MRTPEYFDARESKSILTPVHNCSAHKTRKVKKQIEGIIKGVDPVELLCQISLLTQFFPEGKPESNQDLTDKPTLHFLAGLCLKNGNPSNKHPNNQEIVKTMDLLDKYFLYDFQELILQSAKKKKVSDLDVLILSARLQKMVSQINPNIYKFQLEDFLQNVFSKLDNYFVKKMGFTVSDALNFGRKIMQRYERLLNRRRDKAKEAGETAKSKLRDPIRGAELRETLGKKNITEEEFMEFCAVSLMFTLTKEIFVFGADEFCKDERIKEIEKFKNYLKALSCKFGEVNKGFDSPLDENKIDTRPIINVNNGKYFSPIPKDLIFNLPLIFEMSLSEEKQGQTRIWQKYTKQKTQYTENRIYEYFSRLFPENHIFKNLKYTYQGQNCETDALLLYDNKIFVVESKSGAFTSHIRHGNILRLRNQLRELVEKAYQQGRRVRDYIKSTETAIFKNGKGKKVLKIRFKPDQNDFFLVNVTLEPLMELGTGLKKLQSLGLFVENEFPWSVNLFEFDLITKHIPSPTIFIHYLERRLAAQDEDVFRSFDELSLLAWYLKHGNFYIPLGKDNSVPTGIFLDGSLVGMFDNHYLYGKQAPKLRIQPDLKKIIEILEILHPIGYSNIASALLDFPHKDRRFILKNISKLIEKTKEDGKQHSFTALYKDNLDIGFSFMTQFGRYGLIKRLGSYCVAKKYQTKKRRWIGIGRDVLDQSWFVNAFIYLDVPWKSDAKMDELLKKYPLKGGVEIYGEE